MTSISWSRDFAWYLQDYLMDEHHSAYSGSVWHRDWPHQVYVGQWHILWSSDFAFYLEDYLMEKYCIWDNGSVWHRDRRCKIYMGQWPIFRGPLILPYILSYLYFKNWRRLGVFVPSGNLLLLILSLILGTGLKFNATLGYPYPLTNLEVKVIDWNFTLKFLVKDFRSGYL